MSAESTTGTARRQEFLGFKTLDEEIRVDALPVTGALPDWLTGTLIRNGPAGYEVGDYRLTHWFDGLAMLHRFSFQSGRVSYANRYLRSACYTHVKEQGVLYGKPFGVDPCRQLFGRHFSEYSPNVTDNANVNVTRLTNRFLALVESPVAIEFDPRTLETLGQFSFAEVVPGQISSPHPQYDHDRRVLVNHSTAMGHPGHYNVWSVADGSTDQRLLASVPADPPCYMHSFGMSERYLVFAEFPVVIDPDEFLRTDTAFLECFKWVPERGTRFVIVDKADGSVVRTCQAEAFFAFHHINAFERGDEIVLDITATPNPYGTVLGLPPSPDQLDIQHHGNELRRYTLPLTGPGTADYEVHNEACIEMPRINSERCGMRDYRYVYGLGRSPSSRVMNNVTKADLGAGTVAAWHEPGCFPGEPVFVPAPGAAAEDEGVVLAGVLDMRKGTSFLLVLDGGSFTELARAEVPHHIPSDLHGQFYADVRG
jgi:carotenoid cleavage dioxygenase-like enzyme